MFSLKSYRVVPVVLLTVVFASAPLCSAEIEDQLPDAEPLLLAQSKSKSSSSSTKKSPATSDSKKSSGSSSKSSSKSGTSKSRTSKSSRSSSSASTKKVAAPTSYSLETIRPAIDRLIQPSAATAKWGVKIQLLETGQSVYEFNANTGFIPASTRKLFTGALVLDQLGPEYAFRTYLYHTGTIDSSGTLNGHLVIRPQGDPTFNNRMYKSEQIDWIYKDWVDKVKAANIGFISGELIIDCSEWNMDDLRPKGWAARIMGDSYAPRTSPLTLNENLMGITVKPGKAGEPGLVEFKPPAVGYPVVNNTVTGGKGGMSVRYTPDGSIEVRGNPDGKSRGIPCDNPTLFAAAVFRYHLHTAGVPITGAVRIVTRKNTVPPPTTENVVAMFQSEPMAELVKTMMKNSNNHFAEQMYVAVSAIKSAKGGYTESKKLESGLLQKAGIDPGKIRIEDGSGLSEANAISPDQMCRLLTYMRTHPAGDAFFNALAVGAADGTLRRRMQDSVLAGKVRAKTGHIRQVSCLSGYVLIGPGKTAVFSFLVNKARSSPDGIQDQLCKLIAQLVI